MSLTTLRWGWVLAAALTVGCSPDDSTPTLPPSTSARDSSGIEVVTTVLDFTTPLQRLGEPVVVIGAEDADDPNFEFSYIMDIELFGDGVAVTQQQPPEIRVFDLTGAFVRTIGREGAGPGEFRSVWWIDLVRDTLWSFDVSLRRLSIFSVTGEFIQSWLVNATPVRDGYWVRWATAAMDNGKVLVVAGEPRRQTEPGAVRSLTKIVSWSPGSSVSTEIGPFPGDERDQVAMSQSPFRRVLLHRVLGDRILVVDTEHPDILVFHGTRLERLIQLRGNLDRALDEERLDAFIADYVSEVDDPTTRQRVVDNVRRTRIHDSTPAFASLLVGADSSVWIERYTLTPNHGPAFWIVLDARGNLETTLEVPPYHYLKAVNDRFVVATRMDGSSAVPTVRLFDRPRRSQ